MGVIVIQTCKGAGSKQDVPHLCMGRTRITDGESPQGTQHARGRHCDGHTLLGHVDLQAMACRRHGDYRCYKIEQAAGCVGSRQDVLHFRLGRASITDDAWQQGA
jgi:hypothetical protein